MVDLNLPNLITIGLIAVVTVILARMGFKALGKTSPV